MANPFDQFDKATENPFDQFDEPQAAKPRVNAPEALEAQPEAEPERNWYDPIRELGEGASFGFADEVGSGIAAMAAKIAGDDKEFGQIYDEMMGIVERQRDQYKENFGGEALALNVIGGLASGGSGAAKVMGTKALQNAGNLKKALALAGVGATEGAIAGAGSAKQGERFEGAEMGAKMGAVLPLALRGAGKAVGSAGDFISKRRVANDLQDEAGNFVPINMAADENSTLRNIYQKYIAPSFAGKQVRNQSDKVFKRALGAANKAGAELDSAKTTDILQDHAKIRAAIRNESIPQGTPEELRKAIQNADGQEANALLQEAWKNGFKMVKGREFNINPKVLVKEALSELEDPAMAKFAPEIGGSLVAKLNKGFTPDTAAPTVATRFNPVSMTSEPNPSVVLNSGKIQGDWLMQARNDLRMKAASLSDANPQTPLQRAAYNKAAGKIDNLIKEQLGDGAEAFERELASWGNNRTLGDATLDAVKTGQGLPTSEQILGRAAKYDRTGAKVGGARFQEDVQKSQRNQAKRLERALKKKELSDASLADIQSRMPEMNPTAWQSMSATSIPAAAVAAFTNMQTGGGVLLGLTGINKLAATKTGQKIVAGQTVTQKEMQELLKKLRASDVPDNIISSLNRATIANQED